MQEVKLQIEELCGVGWLAVGSVCRRACQRQGEDRRARDHRPPLSRVPVEKPVVCHPSPPARAPSSESASSRLRYPGSTSALSNSEGNLGMRQDKTSRFFTEHAIRFESEILEALQSSPTTGPTTSQRSVKASMHHTSNLKPFESEISQTTGPTSSQRSVKASVHHNLKPFESEISQTTGPTTSQRSVKTSGHRNLKQFESEISEALQSSQTTGPTTSHRSVKTSEQHNLKGILLAKVMHPLRKVPVLMVFGEMHQKYRTIKVLGEGCFGKVEEVESLTDKSLKYACKTIPIDRLPDPEIFEQELNVAGQLHHPDIVMLHEALRGQSNYYLIMTLCTGGDLQAKIELHATGLAWNSTIPANECVRMWWQMLAGCAYMHHHKLCHRDIKAQNYMLESPDAASPLRLIDFGIAVVLEKGIPLTEKCGTLCYMAPEVWNGSYDKKCDIWSIGVTVYYAFSNALPFINPDQQAIIDLIKTKEPEFSEAAWQNVPEEAQALLKQMLNKDFNIRPSAKKIVEGNQFLREHRNGEPLGDESCCCVAM